MLDLTAVQCMSNRDEYEKICDFIWQIDWEKHSSSYIFFFEREPTLAILDFYRKFIPNNFHAICRLWAAKAEGAYDIE